MDKHSVLSIEKLAAFMDGNLTQDEMTQISQMADDNYELHQMLEANDVIDNTIASFDGQDLQLPDEIIGEDFRIPNVENVDFFSSVGDRFAGNDNLLQQEKIIIEDQLFDRIVDEMDLEMADVDNLDDLDIDIVDDDIDF